MSNFPLLTPWNLLQHGLLVLCGVYILSESQLFRPLRLRLIAHTPKVLAPWVLGLLYCPRCLGFWLGVGIAALDSGFSQPFLPLLMGCFAVAEMKLVYTIARFERDPWLPEGEPSSWTVGQHEGETTVGVDLPGPPSS